MGPFVFVVNTMISQLLLAALCVYGASCQTVDPSGPSYLELYTQKNGEGASITIEEYTHDLSDIGFDNLAKSVCGEGVWLMYNYHSYNNYHWQQTWTEVFAAADYSCHDLPVTHHNDMSSVRFAGTGDINDQASSLLVTGMSPWTVSEHSYSGVAICLEPRMINGAYYGAWNVWDIGMPNNVMSSIRKGCYAEKTLKYEPKQ